MPLEPRQYDPNKASSGLDLQSWEYDEVIGDFVLKSEREIPHRKENLTNQDDTPSRKDFALLGEEVKNERNTNKSRKVERSYPYNSEGVLDFPFKVENHLGADELMEFVDEFSSHTQLVEIGDVYGGLVSEGNFHMDQERYGPYQDVRKFLRAKDGAYKTRVSYQTDTETGLLIRVTRSVVGTAPSAWTNAAGVSVSYKHVVDDIWIKEVRETMNSSGVLVSGSGAFYTYSFYTRIPFTFPTYVRPWDVDEDMKRTLNQHQRRTIFDVRIRTRQAFTTQVWAKKEIEFFAQAPSKNSVTLFEWRYVDWKHDGALFLVDIPNVIANETMIAAITLPNDTYYGAYNETVVFPSSVYTGLPTPILIDTTAYLASVFAGAEELVDVETRIIDNRIWRREKTSVIME